MKKIVLKFGGTSLADAGQFQKVKSIIERNPARRYVVASAPGKRFPEDIKVTDMLYQAMDLSRAGGDFEAALEKIYERYMGIVDELGIDFDLTEDIEKIKYHLKEYPQRSYMASRGEYLNSKILAAYLGFEFVDPAQCVVFDNNGDIELDKTRAGLGARLKYVDRAVIAGFYGAREDGSIITFSRGGSDVTGSLVADAVDADLYENWTDVSGLLAADPRIVENPRNVEYLTYRELRVLSYMGASVLHTDAVYPASRKGIPINIRNTNRPQDPGTMIVRKMPADIKRNPIAGVAGLKGMTVIQIEKIMVSDGAGFTARILSVLEKLQVPFEQCLTGIDTVTLFIRREHFEPHEKQIVEAVTEELNPDTINIRTGLAMITIVGESDDVYANTSKVVSAVDDAGIGIATINQGAGKLNLLVGVREEEYEEAIKAIYAMI